MYGHCPSAEMNVVIHVVDCMRQRHFYFYVCGLFTKLTSLKLLANKMPSLQTYISRKINHLSFKNSLFHHQN